MARISKYKFDENVTGGDYVIGSDSPTGKTRNFMLKDLTSYFGKQDAILGDKFAYQYRRTKQYQNLVRGEISFNNNNLSNSLFENITNIYINKYNASNNDVLLYFSEIVGRNGVLTLHSSENTTYFGTYRVESINNYSGDVIKINVAYIASNGYISDLEYVGVAAVFSVGDKDYTHIQNTASNVWTISHGLNKNPSVCVQDSAGTTVIGEVTYNDKNNLTLNFSGSFSGKAYLN